MNKTFKVVFNKVRGALMVVNEVTSSIQAKGTKTVIAAAAVAGALASGATLATPIDAGADQFKGNGSMFKWDGTSLPEGLNGETFTVTGQQASDIAGVNASNKARNWFSVLETVSGASGSANDLTISMNATTPKSTGQDKQILTVFLHGGDVKLGGDLTKIEVTTDFIGGGNNSLTGIYGETPNPASLEVASKELQIDLTSTNSNGKSVYGVSTAGGKVILNSQTTTINLTSSTERTDNKQYSEIIGIGSSRFDGYSGYDGYVGAVESGIDSAITINVTSKSAKATVVNDKSDYGGGSPAIGLKVEGGGLSLLGTNTVNATANGADAYGVNIVNYFYNLNFSVSFHSITVNRTGLIITA